MEMIYVDSSNVDQIGYDGTSAEVHVIFKNSRHYVYSEVTLEVWNEFLNAPSKGQFVHQEFRAKGYSYREQ